MEIKAYAKVNLILNILGKRSDGFHEIETLFHAIDLFDVVSVENLSTLYTILQSEELFNIFKQICAFFSFILNTIKDIVNFQSFLC